MHLDHRLPWNTLASQLEIIPLNKRYTQAQRVFSTKSRDEFAKRLAYFQRAFYTILTEFSQAEVRKHEHPVAKSFSSDRFLSDRVRDLPEVIFSLGPHSTNSLAITRLAKIIKLIPIGSQEPPKRPHHRFLQQMGIWQM